MRIEYRVAIIAAALCVLTVPISLYNIYRIYGLVGDNGINEPISKLEAIDRRQKVVSVVGYVSAGVAIIASGMGLVKDVRKPKK